MGTRRYRCGFAMVAVLVGAGCLAGCGEDGALEDDVIAIVPQPVSIERHAGVLETRGPLHLVRETAFEGLSRFPLPITRAAGDGPVLTLTRDGAPPSVGDEGYVLEVTRDGVVARAHTPAGIHHALETLRQLLPADASIGAAGAPFVLRIPCCRIEDHPRFTWRGMHLDVCRHFFPVEEVKRFLDLLSLYKFNTFHWHLTEDQGWRIHIERYPKLTEVGAFRAESPLAGDRTQGDGTPYGGFYTQDEIREVVAYAAERFITVVPEIEMPGHAQAAIAAYPELGNTDQPLDVRTRWGVSKHVYNVEDATFTFLENVLDEVLALFPSTFIHIGGDECPKDEWKASDKAQARMQAEGLEDEHALQSWFIRRIETYLAAKERRLIGWDEIQEGGLAPGAAMMVWRNVQYGIDAVKQGHDVVMSPTSHCYFDYYQGDRAHEPEAIGGRLPLERVYAFEPVPDGLTEEEAAHVLGGQGNLWTEYIPTFDHLCYMAFPRAAALAEVLWSPAEARDLDGFLERWQHHAVRLDALGVNHRREPPRPTATLLVIEGAGEVAFDEAPPGTVIRYTRDGTRPTGSSPLYDGPIPVEESGTVTAAAFPASGQPSVPVTVAVVRWDPGDPGPLEPGLHVRGYTGTFRRVPDFDTLEPAWEAEVEEIGFTGREPEERFALRFTGWLRVEEPGTFTFETGSDDGSVLTVAGAPVVSNDGLHGFVRRQGKVYLEPGLYPIECGYFENSGAQRLEVRIEGAASLWRPVTGGR